MIFSPPLRHATLIKRYKRFLADVDYPGRGNLYPALRQYRCHDRLCHAWRYRLVFHLG